MDFGLSLHAGGDFSGGSDLLEEGEVEVGQGLEGFGEGFLVFNGGVCGEKKVRGVACGMGSHFSEVLGGVHDDGCPSFVCG